MKVSTKGRYGLRAIVDIAVYGKDNCVSLNSIADRIGVSENYLEQLVRMLRDAQLVESIRGAQGGYRLNRSPEDITVREVLEVLEGSLYPVDCLDDTQDESSCGEGICEACVTKIVWEKIYTSLTDVVDSITIYDLAKEYNKGVKA